MCFLHEISISDRDSSEPGLSEASEPECQSQWTIRPERPEDAPLVDALNQRAFGPGRFAKSAYRLREGVDPVAALSFVAVEEGRLCGSVRFWPIVIGATPALMLGPLAVEEDLRGRGVGVALMERGIEAARREGHTAMILIGDEPYYARVGFSRLPRGRVSFPGPVDISRVLGLSLKPGALVSLKGSIRRARLDHTVCASSAPLGS
jgi:predicted N-acetyltransferase YhbS